MLEWLEPDAFQEEMSKEVRKRKKTDIAKMKAKIDKREDKDFHEELYEQKFNCTYCGKFLEEEDRSNYFLLSRLDKNKSSLGDMVNFKSYNNIHAASGDTGISQGALRNAREKGNTLIVRRKDKVPFEIG